MYAIYLRKSRTDTINNIRADAEATLETHEKTLTALARQLSLPIGAIYREVVSGETIASRPVMMQLLSEVEQGLWDGVLVMEIERLARGDTMDQGLIAQTFKYSSTKIITPTKTYDPENEFDEEYFEFGLFMSRREYKTINRRQQRGRAAAAEAGKWIANKAPYGWERQKLQNEKGWTLVPHPQENPIMQLIYDLYIDERLGPDLIADRLDSMGIPTQTGQKHWSAHTIRGILTNPANIGMVRSGERPQQKTIKNGVVAISRPHNKNPKLYKALWDGTITQERFGQAQAIMSQNTTGVKRGNTIQNPLAGLVVCSQCGRKMVRRPYQDGKTPDGLMCQNRNCDTVSSQLHLVEERVISVLTVWLEQYKFELENAPAPDKSSLSVRQSTLDKVESEIETLQKQLNNMYDLLEQGVYTPEVFAQRSALVSGKLAECQKTKQDILNEISAEKHRKEAIADFIPRVEQAISGYKHATTPALKNRLLKEVINYVEYSKTTRGKRTGEGADAFEIVLHPKLPK